MINTLPDMEYLIERAATKPAGFSTVSDERRSPPRCTANERRRSPDAIDKVSKYLSGLDRYRAYNESDRIILEMKSVGIARLLAKTLGASVEG